MFALACEAARERLVVSYARRATGESRPRLPSVFFRELASQLEGERVSAEEAPLLRRADVERIAGDAIGAPIPGGRYADDRRDGQRGRRELAISERRARPHLPAGARHPAASRSPRSSGPRRRSRGRSRPAGAPLADRYSRVGRRARAGRAGRDRRAGAAPTGSLSPTSLENYAALPAAVPDGRRAAGQGGRGARADGADRRRCAAAASFHRIFERFYGEWDGQGPGGARRRRRASGCARSPARSATARGERGETGYPAMWEADRLEVIEDCLRWLEVERAGSAHAGAAAGAVRGAVRRSASRREAGTRCRATSRSRSSSAAGTLRAVRPDRPGQLGREAADPLPRRRLQDRQGTRREAGAAAGRADAAAAAVRARRRASCSGSTPAPARRRTSTRPAAAAFSTIEWDGRRARRAPRRRDRRCSARSSTGSRAGDFMVAPWKERAPATTATSSRSARARRGGYVERKRRRPAARAVRRARSGASNDAAALVDQPARERIAGELGANLVRRGRRRHRQDDRARASGSRTCSPPGEVTVDELVVITFTEKAAAELSTRVRDALERRAREADGEEQRRGCSTRRATCTAAHIETIHSFATALLRERPVEAGIDPLFEVLEGLAGSLDFDAAYERFQDELLASTQPDARAGAAARVRARRSCARRASTCNAAPLPAARSRTPAHGDGELDQPPRRARARSPPSCGRCCREHSPGDDSAVDVVEGIVEWIDELEALGRRPSRSALLVSAIAADDATRASARRRTGAGGKQRAQGAAAGRYRRRARRRRRTRLRTDALLGLLPAHRAVRRRLRAQRPQGAARPTSTTCCSGRATCCATAEPARDYFRRRFRVGADRRVPGHRPGAGRARAAADQRRGARRGLARAARRRPAG